MTWSHWCPEWLAVYVEDTMEYTFEHCFFCYNSNSSSVVLNEERKMARVDRLEEDF